MSESIRRQLSEQQGKRAFAIACAFLPLKLYFLAIVLDCEGIGGAKPFLMRRNGMRID